MSPEDKAVLATLENLIVEDRVSVSKALETAYSLGDLAGKLAMASIVGKTASALLKEAA